MSTQNLSAPSDIKRPQRERRIDEILDRKLRLRPTGPYAARTDQQVETALHQLFEAHGIKNASINALQRMTGGASKEQFAFTVTHDGLPHAERMVLRMDPLESVVETCRGREAQILRAMANVVPVPAVRYVDPDGVFLGQPGLITAFVHGVTMPSDMAGTAVSGIGGRFGAMGEKLAIQFIRNLIAIHAANWQAMDLSLFDTPLAASNEAALWQVNAWARAWHDDMVEPSPLMTLTERWLRENAPICEQLVVVHADYRMGNFMFVEPSGEFSAILDWELAHLGDFHEDLGYLVQKSFGVVDDGGEFLVCGLMPREAFLQEYERLSGRTVNRRTLHYYEVLGAWKQAVVVRAAAVRAAAEGNNHQDLLISWLSSASPILMDMIPNLLMEAPDAA